MEYEKLAEKLKEYGIKISFLRKGFYKYLAAQLPEDLEILAAASGMDSKTNPIPVIVTPEKVYVCRDAGFGSVNVAAIKRETITGCDVDGAIVATLNIRTAGTSYSVEKMSAVDAGKLVHAIT